ncbi:hypothetical protein [Parathalassolituus penaei]|uniref:Uncharacterized protein n=1 Tax=Parathalassolituus penaei TaxID=2997323 RepID=A0A9X3EBG2_9GAMM|nr:hypothetical protein [Parathalassolituus penaei]MCY0963769.1 hypothetical protein [Parathalassolituus penaei]
MKKRLLTLLTTSLLSLNLPVQAATLDLPEFTTMHDTYMAVINEKANAEDTAERFRAWQQQYPQEALIGLYIGALDCLIARDAWLPWNKMRYVNRCTDAMDKAMDQVQRQSDPRDQMRAHLERGFVNANLPAMFNRQELAIEDFEAVMKSDRWSQLPESLRQQVTDKLKALKE